MLQYANAFSCVVNNDDNSFVINFIQNAPILTDDPNVVDSEAHEIASIVMSKSGAYALLKSLTDLLNPQEK